MRRKLTYVCIIIMLMFLTSCSQYNNSTYCYDEPQISPSGKYMLEILHGYNGVVHYKRFNISSINQDNKTNPEVIYCSTDTYRVRDELYFVWDDNEDIVWVYSGDVGTSYWTKSEGDQWQKQDHGSGEYPNSLKKLLYN